MKKKLSVLLLIVLLCQALPINALAAIGKVLTGEELAAAYILTGLSSVTGGVQRNAVYHKGMKPNATWNAMQVSDWLDEVMGNDLHSVEDILSRASVAMARLKESNSDAYRRLRGDDPQYATVFETLQQMYIDAEAPAGDHVLTEEEREQLNASTLQYYQTERLLELCDTWKADYEIETHPELLSN